mmetsp:Transcript_27888/g.83370  ORF Transcript_27888/g.83370 Transcript_27888/m.83370 type:complete len:486 (-) Transcript_27888:38-1495(-)
MLEYDAGYWGMAQLVSLRGSVLPKTLVWSLPAGLLAMCVHALPGSGIDQSWSSFMAAWSGYSFVLGTLIVFRINQAYSRYWESATLVHQLRGRWFNSISCLFSFCSSDASKAADVVKFQHTTARFMSMLYCAAVQQLSENNSNMEVLDMGDMDEDSLVFLRSASDKCEVLMQWLQKTIVEAQYSGTLAVQPPILAMTFGDLNGGVVNLNNVRKVRDIPFPFPYAQMTVVLLLIHVMTTPLIAAVVVKSFFLAGLSAFVTVTAYMGTFYITREIEQPFGTNENDLPLSEILRDLNTSLCTLIEQQVHPPPTFDFSVSKVRTIRASGLVQGLKPTYATSFDGKKRSRYSRTATMASVEVELDQRASVDEVELPPVGATQSAPGEPQLLQGGPPEGPLLQAAGAVRSKTDGLFDSGVIEASSGHSPGAGGAAASRPPGRAAEVPGASSPRGSKGREAAGVPGGRRSSSDDGISSPDREMAQPLREHPR